MAKNSANNEKTRRAAGFRGGYGGLTASFHLRFEQHQAPAQLTANLLWRWRWFDGLRTSFEVLPYHVLGRVVSLGHDRPPYSFRPGASMRQSRLGIRFDERGALQSRFHLIAAPCGKRCVCEQFPRQFGSCSCRNRPTICVTAACQARALKNLSLDVLSNLDSAPRVPPRSVRSKTYTLHK